LAEPIFLTGGGALTIEVTAATSLLDRALTVATKM
jgi:hypothetical protein